MAQESQKKSTFRRRVNLQTDSSTFTELLMLACLTWRNGSNKLNVSYFSKISKTFKFIRLLARCAVKCILVLLLSNSVFFLPKLEGLLQFSA